MGIYQTPEKEQLRHVVNMRELASGANKLCYAAIALHQNKT